MPTAGGAHAWAPFLHLIHNINQGNSKMSKTFYTYEQQIHKLEAEKELIINDKDYAVNMLKHFGYYALIGGYKDLFKHKPSGKFLRGVTFEELVTFYHFDESLRTLFFQYILHIEKQIKSLLAYSFCDKYGSDQEKYLNAANYNITPQNLKDISRLVKSLSNVVSLPTHYPYIKHHLIKYHNVPLWVTMNALTFGQAAKMYQYSPSDIRSAVSRNYNNVNEVQLHQFIRILASCRNVCAHGERLYSFHVMEHISNMPLHHKMKINTVRGHYICGTNDLFAVVVSLKYLLDKSEFQNFKRQLSQSIAVVSKNCPHLTEYGLLHEMGFPENWKSINHYKL